MENMKVKRDFAHLKNDELKSLSNTVATDMAAKPLEYTDPNPTLLVMTTNKQTYISKCNAYVLAKDALKQAKLERDNSRLVVVDDLDSQANYIDSVANGDKELITDSGFEAVDSSKTTRAIPGAIEGFKIGVGLQARELIFSCDKNDLADNYLIQTSKTPDDPNSWVISLVVQIKKGTILNLISGENLSVRCAGQNTTGTGPYCRHLTIIVP